MAGQKKIKVILDTNWYVSASINRNARRLFYETFIKSPDLTIFYSVELLSEYKRVITRPKFKRYIRADQVQRFLTFLLPKITRTVVLPFEGVRDPKDNYLIGMCKACGADFLITGDADLLTLGTYEETTILRMNQFLQILPYLTGPRPKNK